MGCLLIMVCCFACIGLFVRMMSLHCHGGVHFGYKRMSKCVKVMHNLVEELFLFWPQLLTSNNGVLAMLPIVFGIRLREAKGDSWCKVLDLALEFHDGGNKQ